MLWYYDDILFGDRVTYTGKYETKKCRVSVATAWKATRKPHVLRAETTARWKPSPSELRWSHPTSDTLISSTDSFRATLGFVQAAGRVCLSVPHTLGGKAVSTKTQPKATHSKVTAEHIMNALIRNLMKSTFLKFLQTKYSWHIQIYSPNLETTSRIQFYQTIRRNNPEDSHLQGTISPCKMRLIQMLAFYNQSPQKSQLNDILYGFETCLS
jgi:hypothetical protein